MVSYIISCLRSCKNKSAIKIRKIYFMQIFFDLNLLFDQFDRLLYAL